MCSGAASADLPSMTSEEGAAIEADGVTRASLSGRARHLAGSPSLTQIVRRPGVEPGRPKTPVPKTGAAANYATSALTPVKGRE